MLKRSKRKKKKKINKQSKNKQKQVFHLNAISSDYTLPYTPKSLITVNNVHIIEICRTDQIEYKTVSKLYSKGHKFVTHVLMEHQVSVFFSRHERFLAFNLICGGKSYTLSVSR